MEQSETLKESIKKMMVENLMLQLAESEIGDDQALFGQNSLGLDSVDALQLVVALEKNFGLKIPDPDTARDVFQNVNTMAAAVERAQRLGRAGAGCD
jgi:acyl carrier protein